MLDTWTPAAKNGLAVILGFVVLMMFGFIFGNPEVKPLPPEQQREVNERAKFVGSSKICKSLVDFGGCRYYPESFPNTITVHLTRVKPQFRQSVASDLLAARDFVPALQKAGFRKLKFTAPDFNESYDLTTEPVSRMDTDYEP